MTKQLYNFPRFFLLVFSFLLLFHSATAIADETEVENMDDATAEITSYEEIDEESIEEPLNSEGGPPMAKMAAPQASFARAGDFQPVLTTEAPQIVPLNFENIPGADTNSGSATYSYPIAVPPGRAGVEPSLSLDYNSKRKNSAVGVGWSLSLGSIQRNTKHGLNYQLDEYIVDNNTELVSKSSEWGDGYFGAKIEQQFTRYFKDPDHSNGWTATGTDGTTYYFGTEENSRQYHPADPGKVFKWCLDRIEDTNGNFLTISYKKNANQIYIDRIDYTGNSTTGKAPAHHVRFIYTENRTDSFTSYIPQFEVKTDWLLSKIITSTTSNKEDDGINRIYSIEHQANNNLATKSALKQGLT